MVGNLDVNVRSNDPNLARDTNCQPANGRKPHRLNNNHDLVMTLASWGQFMLHLGRRSETYDSHVYLVLPDNVGSANLLPLSHFATLVKQSLFLVLAIVRHVVLLFHDMRLPCPSRPAVCLGGVTQAPSVWSTL